MRIKVFEEICFFGGLMFGGLRLWLKVGVSVSKEETRIEP